MTNHPDEIDIDDYIASQDAPTRSAIESERKRLRKSRHVWAEKDFFGTVTIKAQDEGHEPMTAAQLFYNYAMMDNGTQHALTKQMIEWFGGEWDGRYESPAKKPSWR